MSINERLVSVDNTDPSIKWAGPWFSTQGHTDEWGDNGPPFLSTLQGITTNGSLSFSFRGRDVYVRGSLRPRNVSIAGATVLDPDWDCFLDGNNIGKFWDYPSSPLSNFALCSGGDISDGNHTLVLKATVRDETLWVDQIQYRASIDTDVSTTWTEVHHGDGRLRYSGNWSELKGGLAMATTAHDARFTYEFNGEGIVLGGYTPGYASAIDGLGTYALDDGPPTIFAIPASAATKRNQPYFSITRVTPGPHRLEVTNKGNDSTVPLAFSYIYTKNALNSAPSAVKSKNTSKIIGGAVGGGLGLLILAALLIYAIVRIRRSRRRPHLIVTTGVLETETSTSMYGVASLSNYRSASTLQGDGQAESQSESPAARYHTSQRQSLSIPHSSLPLTRSSSPPPAYAALPSHPPLTFSSQPEMAHGFQGRRRGSGTHNEMPLEGVYEDGIQSSQGMDRKSGRIQP